MMKALQTRVQRLEGRYSPPPLCPWETANWECLSATEKLLELQCYRTASPDRALARQFRALERLSAVERQARIAALTAKAGATV